MGKGWVGGYSASMNVCSICSAIFRCPPGLSGIILKLVCSGNCAVLVINCTMKFSYLYIALLNTGVEPSISPQNSGSYKHSPPITPLVKLLK